jgi:small redox-active disulfide protein 2
MKVQILGTGCPKCRALAANAEKALAELGIAAEIEKVEKIADIARMGVMMTPALAVDGQVKSVGLQSVEKVKEILAGGGGARTPLVSPGT